VWAGDDAAARHLAELPQRLVDTHLEPPQIVVFSLPAPYAAAYRRAAELLADKDAAAPLETAAVPASLPRPRAAAEESAVVVPSGT
jgi:hypothetical protein